MDREEVASGCKLNLGRDLSWVAKQTSEFPCKYTQVNASAHKAWPNGVTSRPKFSTCEYLRVRLARA